MSPHTSSLGFPEPSATLLHDQNPDTGLVAPRRIGLEDMDATKYAAFGSLFILSVNATLFPLDTLTTIMMADHLSQNQSIRKLILQTARKEGILRFWRGLAPSVLGAFPAQATYYYAYETVQNWTKSIFKEDGHHSIFAKGFLSGACAELAGGVFYVPADVVSQRLQIQDLNGFTKNRRLYTGPFDVIRRTFRFEGLKGFYRGYLAYISSYAPGSAVQWGSYELSKDVLFRTFTVLERSRILSRDGSPISHKQNIVNALSGGIAAFCAVSANNPLEVVRVRHQLLDTLDTKQKQTLEGGYLPIIKRIYREEGWRGFYKGIRVRMFMAIPTAMIAMSGYETVKAWSLD